MNTHSGRTWMYYWLPLLFWMALIFYLSHQDGESSAALSDWIKEQIKAFLSLFRTVEEKDKKGPWGWILRKTAHATEYAILCVLAYRAFQLKMEEKKALFYAFLGSVVYAMTDEFHQSFIPGRGPSWRDVGIDSLGALVAIGVLSRLPKRNLPLAVPASMEK